MEESVLCSLSIYVLYSYIFFSTLSTRLGHASKSFEAVFTQYVTRQCSEVSEWECHENVMLLPHVSLVRSLQPCSFLPRSVSVSEVGTPMWSTYCTVYSICAKTIFGKVHLTSILDFGLNSCYTMSYSGQLSVCLPLSSITDLNIY
jgi:hypothetical protein